MILSETRMCYANHKETCKYYLVSLAILLKDNSSLKVKSQPSATRLHNESIALDTGDTRLERNKVNDQKSLS